MKIRKKYSLAIFMGVSAVVMVFYGIKGPELTAFGIIAIGILGAFGAADVYDKKFKGDK